MSSSSSLSSSITESQSTSSSSGDIARTGKSSLVFQPPVLTPSKAIWAAVLDLDAIDTEKMLNTAWHYVDMSGTYEGYVVKVYRVKLEDGAKFVLRISPRMGSLAESATVTAWQEALLGRVRAELAAIREEYDTAMSPGDTPLGIII